MRTAKSSLDWQGGLMRRGSPGHTEERAAASTEDAAVGVGEATRTRGEGGSKAVAKSAMTRALALGRIMAECGKRSCCVAGNLTGKGTATSLVPAQL
jgi:hypothetical protein